MKKISIVVPAYNAQNCIGRCLESLINQTYENIEIIVVNDGSSDNTQSICETYAQKDSRIKVYHQKNAGPSVARSKGIDFATGEYIGFVDADDIIEPSMYETMLAGMLEHNAQLAVSDVNVVTNKGKQIECLSENGREVLNRAEMMDIFFNKPLLCFSVWNKLFARELIGDLRFDNSISMSEDQKFMYEVLKKANRILHEPTAFYSYDTTQGNSLTRSSYKRKHMALIDVNDYIIADTDSASIKQNATLYNAITCLNIFVPHYGNEEMTKEDRARIDKIIRDNAMLVFTKGYLIMKVKILLYLISPELLSYLINKTL